MADIKIKPRRGLKANLPATVSPYEILVTTDTREVYVADVNGAPKKYSDVLFSSTKATLPATGKTHVIYVVEADETNNNQTILYRYTGSAYVTMTKLSDIDDAVIASNRTWSSQKISTSLAGKSDTGHDHTAANITDFSTAADARIAAKRGVANGIASLDATGLVPAIQLPSNLKEMRVVADIAARDALTTFEGLRAFVVDATGDVTVASGWAEYLWDGDSWVKTGTSDSVSVVTDWANIENGPTSSAADIDDAVTKKHAHTNKTLLDALSDTGGKLYYNGAAVSSGGDMLKSTYDSTNNGKVDVAEDAEKLGGNLPAYYEKDIPQQSAAPANPVANDLWIDTSVTPHVLKRFDGVTWQQVGKDGVTTFLALGETPDSFTGQAGKMLVVNAGATALEFAAVPAVINTLTGLVDVPDSYAGQAGKVLRVNTGATGVEFATVDGNTNVKVGATIVTGAPSVEFAGSGSVTITPDAANKKVTILGRAYDIGNFNVAYGYNASGDVSTETITGDITRTTTFTYFTSGEFLGKVETETIVEGGKTITKTYSYETGTGNLTNVAVTTA